MITLQFYTLEKTKVVMEFSRVCSIEWLNEHSYAKIKTKKGDVYSADITREAYDEIARYFRI